MWGIPAELIERGNDEPILKFVGNRTVDPQLFLRQVISIFTKVKETSKDETLLSDGRIFERYSAPMFGQDEQYLGRVWYFHDVSESKRAVQALRESEERFRKAFLTSPDAININRLADGMYVSINKGFTQIMGYSAEEAAGKTSLELNIWAYPEDRKALVASLTQNGEVVNLEARFRAKNGDIHYGLMSASVFDLNNVAHIISITRDITERKKMEAETQANRNKLETALASMNDAVFISDNEGRFIEFNDAFATFHRFKTKAECAQTLAEYPAFLEVSFPDGQLAPLEQWAVPRALRGEVGTSVEYGLRRKDTGEAWIGSYSFAPIRDAEGAIIGSVVVGRDISDRKHAEERLRESEERYRTVADYTYDWEYWRAPDGKVLYISPSCERITGYSIQDFMENPDLLDSIVHFEDHLIYEEHHSAIEHEVNDPSVHETDFRIRRRDGEMRWIGHTCQLIRRSDGTKLGRRATNRDITERKIAEEEVYRLNQTLEMRVKERTIQLEAANKELEAFAYSVSHDLRAPLRGIDGWSLALLEDYHDQLDEQGQKYLDRVRTEANRMGQLIDDLLLLSRVTRAEMQTKPVDLSGLAQTIVARLQAAQPERQVAVTIQPGLTTQGDAALLGVVLTNLLDNAWKFTGKRPAARIEFGQTLVDGQPTYFVCDNGAGFDMAYAQKLFGAFQRLHKNTDFPGTGVGLATVQRIVRRHGGQVWAEAQVDQGATFFFTLQEVV
jgi:PAS domain S-box-containing protein